MESVFGTLRVATGIAGYFGLVDSVSVDVKKLVHQAFLSAKDNRVCSQCNWGKSVGLY